MIRRTLSRLASWFGGAEDDEESGSSRFVPSPLDRSVRVAHGGNGDEIDRELAAVESKARMLDERRRD